MSLFIFGLGYSSLAVAQAFRDRRSRVSGTVRTPEKAHALTAHGIEAFVFDGERGDPRIPEAIAAAQALLASIPPGPNGDPAAQRYGPQIAASRRLRWIGYFSTVGVYGDQGGDWVDEDTPARPTSPRGAARLSAEAAWAELGARGGKAVAALRLPGIYGPGRSAFDGLRDGTARRIVKPGQVFNRVHVADIAGAVCALEACGWSGPVNVCDDEPCPPQEVTAYAARLLGVAPPPEEPFESAALSPMARSFYAENKRVANARLKNVAGFRLRFPSYREGLADILAKGG